MVDRPAAWPASGGAPRRVDYLAPRRGGAVALTILVADADRLISVTPPASKANSEGATVWRARWSLTASAVPPPFPLAIWPLAAYTKDA